MKQYKYQQIEPKEALRLLYENNGEPVEGLFFKDNYRQPWLNGYILSGVNLTSCNHAFIAKNVTWNQCARRIECVPLITEKQRQAIKLLFPNCHWLAQDKDGKAMVYPYRPIKNLEIWVDYRGTNFPILALYNYASNWKKSLVDLDEVIE